MGTGALYNVFGGQELLDPQVLPFNTAKIPCVQTLFNIIPINQPGYASHVLTIPPSFPVEVRGSGGNGYLYATIEGVPYETFSETAPPTIQYFIVEPDGSLRAPSYDFGQNLVNDYTNLYWNPTCNAASADADGNCVLPPAGQIFLDGWDYWGVQPDTNAYYIVTPTVVGIPGPPNPTFYEVGLTYSGAGITPVDAGQEILILGTSLTVPFGATADATQFGQIYAEYFTLPTPPWS